MIWLEISNDCFSAILHLACVDLAIMKRNLLEAITARLHAIVIPDICIMSYTSHKSAFTSIISLGVLRWVCGDKETVRQVGDLL